MGKKNSANAIRIGIQPTGWTNDDFPEIGDDTPYEQILDETAKTGYAGGSTGHNYPQHLPSLNYELKKRGLGITSTWVGTHFTAEGQFNQTLEDTKKQIEFLKAVGATDIVVAELAGAINQVRVKSVLDDRPIFNEPQRYLLATGLNEAGKLAKDAGMRLSYHHHVGTGVQIDSEIDDLMANTVPEYVWLCVDTGHARYSGVDPEDLTRRHLKRIGHVHLKSVRLNVVEKAVKGKWSFYQAIQEGIFTVPGDPDDGLKFDKIFEMLKKQKYEGWIVVEAEQNPANANPLRCAQIARKFIRDNLGV
jgi:inosose dehydratase